MFKLFPLRKEIQGMPDLLNYEICCDDGIILCKDGTFLAGFAYRAPDLNSSTASERNRVIQVLHNALCQYGTSWMLHADTTKKVSPTYLEQDPSMWGHPIFNAIDNERRELFVNGSQYESEYTCYLTYLPPSKNISRAKELMFESSERQSTAKQHLEYFKKKINDFLHVVSHSIPIRRMKTYKHQGHYYCELLQKINFAISGVEHPVRLPMLPIGIDSVIGAHEFWGGLQPKIGKKHIKVITVDDYPDHSHPQMLASLDRLPIAFRWSSRMIFMSQEEAEKILKKEQKKWGDKIVSFKDQLLKKENPEINKDALGMYQEYQHAIELSRQGDILYGHYSSTIVLMDEDEQTLLNNCDRITSHLLNQGFGSRIESVNTIDAYLGTLPSDSIHNVRRPIVSTENLAHLLSTTSIWSGLPTNPCQYYPPKSPAVLQAFADSNAPFRLNTHVGDLGHFLVVGPPGAGKSTLLSLLAVQSQRYRPNMWIFDFKRSAYAISHLGGTHYDIGVDPKIRFAPLSHAKDDLEWTCEYVASVLEIQGLDVTARHRTKISEALKHLVAMGGDINFTELRNIINDQEISENLEYYCDGAGNVLLNATEDSLSVGDQSTMHCFETQELYSLGDKAVLPVLLYIFRRIEKALDGRPSFLYLDEAWVSFKEKKMREKIDAYLRILRDANCVIGLFTQGLREVKDSGMLELLTELCPTKIFLPNPEAENPTSKSLYVDFGLNDRQISLIANSQKKRDYYLVSQSGSRKFTLSLENCPIAMSFVGVGGKAFLPALQDTINSYGEKWYLEWLYKRGVLTEQEKLDAMVADIGDKIDAYDN